MNTHSFETYQILRQIPGFEEIALWAAYHHEEPGGKGYPFHLRAETLPLEARILRIADIFQAMTQHRPYRTGLMPDAVCAFMDGLVRENRLEAELLAVIKADLAGALSACSPERWAATDR